MVRAEDERQHARIGDGTGGRVALLLAIDDARRDQVRMTALRAARSIQAPGKRDLGTVAVRVDPSGYRWDLPQHARSRPWRTGGAVERTRPTRQQGRRGRSGPCAA